MNNNTWITVKSFPTPIEAQLAQSFLLNEGIESFVRDEHSVGMRPHLSLALGGVRLDVRTEHAERALTLLEQADENTTLLLCPECGSGEVNSSEAALKVSAVVATVVAGVPMPFARAAHTCGACGHSWRGGAHG